MHRPASQTRALQAPIVFPICTFHIDAMHSHGLQSTFFPLRTSLQTSIQYENAEGPVRNLQVKPAEAVATSGQGKTIPSQAKRGTSSQVGRLFWHFDESFFNLTFFGFSSRLPMLVLCLLWSFADGFRSFRTYLTTLSRIHHTSDAVPVWWEVHSIGSCGFVIILSDRFYTTYSLTAELDISLLVCRRLSCSARHTRRKLCKISQFKGDLAKMASTIGQCSSLFSGVNIYLFHRRVWIMHGCVQHSKESIAKNLRGSFGPI